MNDLKKINEFEPFEISWSSPSNIALVKYWGKTKTQLPLNPSVSFSLKNSITTTTVRCIPRVETKNNRSIDIEFDFEKKPNKSFQLRIEAYLNSVIKFCPFLEDVKLVISSKNLFPHSCGIASSASSMSALALCLCSIEETLSLNQNSNSSEFKQKASILARLGSGSACRSIYGNYVSWGKSSILPQSSDEYSTSLTDIHETFLDFRDSILIVDSTEKKISSSKGHQLMENHIFSQSRLGQANLNFEMILKALKNGDVKEFGRIVEAEAMTLHALMMTSNPPYFLMKPATLAIIDLVLEYRKDSGLDLYFTLDAGANIHLLYPNNVSKKVKSFIESELLTYTENRSILVDQIGSGPCQLQ